jgi:hypothetical protein
MQESRLGAEIALFKCMSNVQDLASFKRPNQGTDAGAIRAGVKQFATALFVAALLVLFSASTVWAWPPTYGPEFEFTTVEMSKGGSKLSGLNAQVSPEVHAQMKMVARMKIRCLSLGCTVEVVKGKWDKDFKVSFADGWWFKISSDPGCVEVTFKPSTLAELEIRKDQINDAIFKTAYESDLFVRTDQKNSHFNFGVRSAFNDSAENFLRYFVDYANHPELALGGVGMDLRNAPPLSVLQPSQRTNLQKVIEQVRTGQLNTLSAAIRAVQTEVYTNTYNPKWATSDGIIHYQALGLKYAAKANLAIEDAPAELRAMWIQQNAEQFILIARLVEGRIAYLNSLDGPIIYTQSSRQTFTARELKTRFFIYVEEAGLKFEDFQDLVRFEAKEATLDPLVASSDPRIAIQSVEKYWDLMLTSEWMRKKVIEILAAPEVQDSKHREHILRRIKSESLANENSPVVRRSWNNLYGILKPKSLVTSSEEYQLRQAVWKDLFEQVSAPMCRKLFQGL